MFCHNNAVKYYYKPFINHLYTPVKYYKIKQIHYKPLINKYYL